jgi:hypothetical protein
LRGANNSNTSNCSADLQQTLLKKDRQIKEKDGALKGLLEKTKKFAIKIQADLKKEKKLNEELKSKCTNQQQILPDETLDDKLLQKDKLIAEKDGALMTLKTGIKSFSARMEAALRKEKTRRKKAEENVKRMANEFSELQGKYAATRKQLPQQDKLHLVVDVTETTHSSSESIQFILEEAKKLVKLDLSDSAVIESHFGVGQFQRPNSTIIANQSNEQEHPSPETDSQPIAADQSEALIATSAAPETSEQPERAPAEAQAEEPEGIAQTPEQGAEEHTANKDKQDEIVNRLMKVH